MQESKAGFGDIMSELAGVIRAHGGMIALTAVVIMAIYTAFDMTATASVSTLPNIAISVFGQYLFVEALMPEYRAQDGAQKRRYGSVLAAGIIGGLGIVVGFVLLVLPGLYLAARWSISTPFIVVEGQSSTQSLKSSWQATERSSWSILLVLLACSMPLALLFVGLSVALHMPQEPQSPLLQSILTNSLVSVWLVGNWCLSVAIFRRLNPASGAYDAVFA